MQQKCAVRVIWDLHYRISWYMAAIKSKEAKVWGYKFVINNHLNVIKLLSSLEILQRSMLKHSINFENYAIKTRLYIKTLRILRLLWATKILFIRPLKNYLMLKRILNFIHPWPLFISTPIASFPCNGSIRFAKIFWFNLMQFWRLAFSRFAISGQNKHGRLISKDLQTYGQTFKDPD